MSDRNTILESTRRGNRRKLGRIALPIPESLSGTEPKPFVLNLPPLTHLLNVVVTNGTPFLYFWYWEQKTTVRRQGSGVIFVPSEPVWFLFWFPGDPYSGALGTFLQSVPLNGVVGHLFDLTRYNDATGEVVGRLA